MRSVKVALLRTSDSFVINELARHFRLRNHAVEEIRLETRREGGEEWVVYDYHRLLEALFRFRPDFVVSLNHRGLNDSGGKVVRLLSLLQIPVFSWHLDSPFWNLDAVLATDSPYLTLFCFDRSYIEPLRARLQEARVAHLPNATDPDLFRPLPERERDRWECTFVGNLCRDTFLQRARQVLGEVPEDRAELESLLDRLRGEAEGPGSPTGTLGNKECREERIRRLLDEYAAYLYRSTMIRAVVDLGVVVFGDEDWLELVPPDRFMGRARYYRDLPRIYAGSRISLNLSRPQVRTALNQRFFDVPAAGGFLLSDFREDIGEVFEIGRDIAVFRSGEELRERIREFLSDPAARDGMARRARRKVLDAHTYSHRVDAMTAHLERVRPELRKEGLETLFRIWEGDDAFHHACRILAQFLFRKGDVGRGRFLYEYLDRCGKGDAELWTRLGAVASQEGDLDRSAGYLARALKEDPDHAAAHAVAAVNEQKRGRLQSALRHLRRSIDLGNADPQVFRRAVALRRALQPPVPSHAGKPRIAFLVSDANLPFGGVRVLLEYADRLACRGYPVFLLTEREQYSDWFPLRVPVVSRSQWKEILGRVDAVVWSQHGLGRWIPVRRGLARIFLVQHVPSDPEDIGRAEATFTDAGITLVGVSEFVRHELKERFGREAFRIRNGVDLERFRPDPERWDGGADPAILYCYSSNEVKGWSVGREVLRRVLQQCPDRKVLLFGLEPPPPAEFRFSYRRNPEQVEIPRFYARAGVFLSTSRMEGFGLPCLEAMACACPVVTTDNGGNRDFCRHEENALVYEYGDVDGLAAGVERVLRDPALADRLARGGLDTARRFDWKESVGRLEDLLREKLGA